MKFFSTPMQVCRGPSIPYFNIKTPFFCCLLFSKEYIIPQVKIDYQPSPSGLTTRIILSCFYRLIRSLSLSRIPVKCSLKPVYPREVYYLQSIGKCIYILLMPPHAIFLTRILSLHSRQKIITQTPRKHFFKNLCLSSKGVGGNYDVTIRPFEIICHFKKYIKMPL